MIDLFQTNGSSPPKRFCGYYPGQIADTPDFVVSNHGSIFLLQPLTTAALAGTDEHLPAERQLWGSSAVIEHRFIADIVAGIQRDGLVLR